ncbi:Anaphase promoting complex subunit 11 [Allomyces arbusculus]|nr:Anaphase promoting complex subunit 11 [Allomyces arbusculus]
MAAAWHWDTAGADDTCGFCHDRLEAPCPSCHHPGDTCPPTRSRECPHLHHEHCMAKSTRLGNAICPLCRKDWILVDGPAAPGDDSFAENAENQAPPNQR